MQKENLAFSALDVLAQVHTILQIELKHTHTILLVFPTCAPSQSRTLVCAVARSVDSDTPAINMHGHRQANTLECRFTPLHTS